MHIKATHEGKTFEGNLVLQGQEPQPEPTPEPTPIQKKREIGEKIYVADFISNYDFSNEWDITDALEKAIEKAWGIAQLRYHMAKAHPREPRIEGRPFGTWSKSASAHIPTIVFPEGSFRIYRDIYIPGHFSLIGEEGWNTVLRFMNGARLHVLGTFTTNFGIVQTIGGTIRDLKIVPDGEKRNLPMVNLYGNLSNWDFDHVHIMNANNRENAAIYHHSIKGFKAPFGTTETQGNVHLKECSIRNCQLEFGRIGISIRGPFDCNVNDNKIVYMDHGIHIGNGRQSKCYNNTVVRGQNGGGGNDKGAIGISATSLKLPVPFFNNHVIDYDIGMITNSTQNRLVEFMNTFEGCNSGTTFNEIYQLGPWKAPSDEGLMVKDENLWYFGLKIDEAAKEDLKGRFLEE